MSTSNRSSLIAKTHKVLKKHYKPVSPPERSLLEHLLYACCLENAPYDKADEVFAKLQQLYFDWNEVRVTTVTELTDTMAPLPAAAAAALRLRKTLQSVFETHYAFDIEFLHKQNLGQAVAQFEQYQGPTRFTIAYVTQCGLGGHAIAVDRGALDALHVVGVIDDKEYKQEVVPGLERAIPKSKGVEFGSLLHQLSADYFANPLGKEVQSVLTAISPEAKERLPSRKAESSASKKSASRGAAAKKTARSSGGGKKSSSAGKKKSAAASKPSAKKNSSKRLAKKKPR